MMKFARAALAASLLAVATDSLAQWAGCPDKPDPSQKATAIDTGYGFDASNPEAIRFLEAAKATGIKTIIRYYDWAHRPGQEPESLAPGKWEQSESLCQKIYTSKRCGGALTPEERGRLSSERCTKTLTLPERNLILSHGFNIVIVFQHFNECLETWLDAKRASYDAARALELARSLSQPPGSAIYFGVDGADERFADRGERERGIGRITRYFEVIGTQLRKAGYKIGIYGSGYACRKIKDERHLASYCWISQSRSHQGSEAYIRSGDWAIKQCLSNQSYNKLGGVGHDVDPNVVNPALADFGQWRPEGSNR